jgi:hypothetical protein
MDLLSRNNSSAIKVLLNMSTHAPFRRKIAESLQERNLRVLFNTLTSACVSGQIRNNTAYTKDDGDAVLGMMANMALDDGIAAKLCEGGAVMDALAGILSELRAFRF